MPNIPKSYSRALQMATELRGLTGEERNGPLTLEEEASLMHLESKTFVKSGFTDFDFEVLWNVCCGYRRWAKQDLELRMQLIEEGD